VGSGYSFLLKKNPKTVVFGFLLFTIEELVAGGRILHSPPITVGWRMLPLYNMQKITEMKIANRS